MCANVYILCNFGAQKCSMRPMFCPISVVLCAEIAGCSNFSHCTALLQQVIHTRCTARLLRVRHKCNVYPQVCNSSAQYTELSHRECINYTGCVIYTVIVLTGAKLMSRVHMKGTLHLQCTLTEKDCTKGAQCTCSVQCQITHRCTVHSTVQ